MADDPELNMYVRKSPFKVVFSSGVKLGRVRYFRKGVVVALVKLGEPCTVAWDEVHFSNQDRWVWPQ